MFVSTMNTKASTVKTDPCFRWSHSCFAYEGETGGEGNLVIFEDNLSTSISMKRSRQEFFIDIGIHMSIFKNKQIMLFLCLTFIPKIRGSFYEVMW